MSPVSPAEGNLSIFERDQAVVGNGHSMRVTAEIAEYMLRAPEWPFDVKDPVLAIEFADEGVKGLRVREMLQFAVKADLALGECLVEGILHLPSKHSAKRLLGQKEPVALCSYPAPVIEGQSTGRDDAVNVRMMLAVPMLSVAPSPEDRVSRTLWCEALSQISDPPGNLLRISQL
jgi:hypothetical protein